MKRFYFILYLVSGAVWGQESAMLTISPVNCSLPTTHNNTFNFTTANNGITGNYNAFNNIVAVNEVSNTAYLAPEITVSEGFKATANQSVLLSIETCPFNSDIDLTIKDGVDDVGSEPNTITPYMWVSTDIWTRNNDDNGLEHQNPEYHPATPNWAYVRVKNRGTQPSTGTETVTLYWAKAGASLSWPDSWNGLNNFTQTPNPVRGEPIGTLNVQVLQPNEEVILEFPFLVPNPANYSFFAGSEQWHFCLLARVESSLDPMTFPETWDLNANVRNNNNIAWKNITIVDVEENITSGGIIVGNPFNTPRHFFLELIKEDIETGKPIYEEAEVTIKMDDILYNAWKRGGEFAQNIEATQEEKNKIVKGNNVIIDNIYFEPNETGFLTLDFKFLIDELTDKNKFDYHVIQKDGLTGEIIGGETFIINKKSRNLFDATAPDKQIDKFESITLSAQDIMEPAIYNWYDSEGNLIFEGKDLYIANAVAEKYKLEVISTIDGFKDYKDVNVTLKPNRLETLFPNPSTGGNLNITYKINEANSAYLMITSYYMTGATSYNYIIDKDATEKNIDINYFPNGFYKVALVTDGQIVDVKILSKW